MSYTHWTVVRTPFENNSWNDGLAETIENVVDCNLNTNLGETRDTFNLTVTNFSTRFTDFFGNNDRITFYRSFNSEVADTSSLVFVGTVRDTPFKKTSNQNSIRVSGYNYTEALLGSLVFIDVNNLTPPEIIETALNNAGSLNQNFKVEWDSSNDTVISGLTFPTVGNDRLFNVPLRKVIEKYSQPQETDNGSFYWFIDTNNKFIWRPVNNNPEQQTFTFNSNTDGYKELSIKKDTNDVINYVIIKGGYDAAGRQVQTRYVDWSSLSKHGSRFKFLVSDANQAKDLIDRDILKSYGLDQSPDGYPVLSSSFTTEWLAQFTYTTTTYGISVTEGSPVVINEGNETDNKKAYNEVVRTEVKKRLQKEGEEFVRDKRFGKVQLDLTFNPGTKEWVKGDNVDITIPEFGGIQTTLRVQQIQQTLNADVFSLREDEGSL